MKGSPSEISNSRPTAQGRTPKRFAHEIVVPSVRTSGTRLFVLLVGFLSAGLATPTVSIPLVCSRGPEGQQRRVSITAPAVAKTGAMYTLLIEGKNSGTVSHTGLNYIFDMVEEWPIPAGARYVEGSARIVPQTGSLNVRPGARIERTPRGVALVLPAHVDNGSSYTPPSFELELQATAAPGTSIAQTFGRFSLKANAFLVGDVFTTCEPSPQSYPVFVTKVEPSDH
jgi:hypothetical protein